MRNLYVILLSNLVLFSIEGKHSDRFDEELLIKPLVSGHLYSYFRFTTLWDVDITKKTAFQHYNLFPRALGEIVAHYHIRELHLSLTQGLWKHYEWGYPVTDAPPGAELWVWFLEETEDVNQTWKELTNALAGLFCASLNFIDDTNSVQPEMSFRPVGVADEVYSNNSTYVRYAALPRENVCTENLTPWKKLLPCDSKRGLSTLLNAGYIHNTNYHSIGVHLRPVCRDATCTASSVELSQSVSLVHEPSVLNKGRRDWSLRKIYGLVLAGSCPLGSAGKIYIDITNNQGETSFTLAPTPHQYKESFRGDTLTRYAVYDLKQLIAERAVGLSVTYKEKKIIALVPSPGLHANRYVIGYGQERGGIVTKLYNKHWSQPLTVVYMENIPWFLRMYLHTLKIVSKGQEIQPLYKHYVPGRDRQRPYHLEIVLELPPASVTEVSFQFDRAFLKWLEYPPDANHGFYVGSAVISTVLPTARNYTGIPQWGSTIASSFNASEERYFLRLYTETLLVTLPTPDFSMPYNVICLACTVIALAFGPLHNMTTKRLALRDLSKKKGYFRRIKDFFRWGRPKPEADESDAKKQVNNMKEEPSEVREAAAEENEEIEYEVVQQNQENESAMRRRNPR